MSAEEIAEVLSRFVNGSDTSKLKELAKLMTKDHRTLQQLKMKLACLFIEEMASQEFYDARNEASVKAAKAMIEGFKSKYKEDIISQDGVISEGLRKYIDREVKPSEVLPLI